LVIALALAGVAALSMSATAAPAKAPSASAKTLAKLKVQTAQVTLKKKGKTSYAPAKSGQVLHQGDSIKTDAAGKAEIDYTDGSLTRLGNATEFKISKLTNKQGGRQTQGTLSVGETWNRAAKVSETGSFEVKAGGTTAAVEGTAFSVVCVKAGTVLTCTFTDVVDNVSVSTGGGAQAQLGPSTSIVVTEGNLGTITQLTYDQITGNLFIAGNLVLDQQGGIGSGLGDVQPATTSTTTPPAGGTGGAGPAAAGTGGAGDPTVTAADTPGTGGVAYTVVGGIVVDNPNVQVGGEMAFHGTGCAANETLDVLFDGRSIGTLVSNANGEFAGSMSVPAGTPSGTHLLTVRGAVCVFNATITVSGGSLAFTGSSSHTSTYVFGAFAAIAVGFVLVVATRRRWRGVTHHSSSPPPSSA
jgi:hypothetical protein